MNFIFGQIFVDYKKASSLGKKSEMGKNLGKYIRQPLPTNGEAAESELMTRIVPYATKPRFMAKKIPQSDL